MKREEDVYPPPKWIAWEVTQRCNLTCIHCRCSSDESAHEGVFSTQAAFALIDDIARITRPVLVLSGGEPLLRKDIFEIAGYATSRGFRTCMATNGLLVNSETCTRMKRAGIQMVALSLDGPNAMVHDSFRRVDGAFASVLEAARLLKENDIPFLINSSFTRRNAAFIPDTFRLAKSLGAHAWYMFIIVPMGRGKDLLDELISQPQYDEILKWHYELESFEQEVLLRPTCAPHYFRLCAQLSRAEGKPRRMRSLALSTGAHKGCVAGQTICMIDAFGYVHPCSYLEPVAGNVLERPFEEIWQSSELLCRLREAYKGRCGVCEYRNICGGCRARALTMKGDILEEDPLCHYVPVRMHGIL